MVLLDFGHGVDTHGKASPDGSFREWDWNRQVGMRVYRFLMDCGIETRIVVTEDEDISLAERVRRINAVCDEVGVKNVILVSIHSDAAGSGREWMQGRGWSCYTTKGQTESDNLAECLYDVFEDHFPDRTFRYDRSDGDRDKEKNFYIIFHSKCPAVLIEDFFYDNKEECAWLLQDVTKDRIANAIGMGIYKYMSR